MSDAGIDVQAASRYNHLLKRKETCDACAHPLCSRGTNHWVRACRDPFSGEQLGDPHAVEDTFIDEFGSQHGTFADQVG